ncbi:MAG: hypothetical protein EB053_00835 [Chlamydiae bacterium]|nr:hypothetical protein [Chlamydiota bacterium]
MHRYIQRILIASIAVSLLPTFLRAFQIHLPIIEWLGVSSFGLKTFKWFQIFTFPLLFSFDIRMDALALLTPLFMIFVARLANFILEIEGPKSLLGFYIGSCVFTTTLLYLYGLLAGSGFFYFGPQPLFYALISYSLFILPEMELLFFVIPMRAKTFIWVGLALSFIFSIESKDYTAAIATLSGAMFGYLYGLKKLKQHSPFLRLKSLEKYLFRFFEYFKARQKCVIVDFKTGRQIPK